MNISDLTNSNKCSASLLAAISNGFEGYRINSKSEICFEILFYASKIEGSMLEAFWKNLGSKFATSPTSRLSTIYSKFLAATPFGSATVSSTLFLEMLAIPEIEYIDLASHLQPKRDVSLPLGRSPDGVSAIAPIAVMNKLDTRKHPTQSDASCLLGLIDFGFPFAHQQYQDRHGTRIQAIWDQDKNAEFRSESGTRPEGFGYGRQVTASKLNEWIDEGKKKHLSESEIYRLAHCPSMASRITHGSSSLSILAAKDASVSIPKRLQKNCNNPIVLVQIPYALPLAPNTGAAEKAILDGIVYIIFSAASQFKKIVVSIAYGSYLGPHDGLTRLEKALEFLVDMLKANDIELNIVFASGNGFNKSVHAVSPEQAKEVQHVDWWLPPSRDTLVFADAWFDLAVNQSVSIELASAVNLKPHTLELKANKDSIVSSLHDITAVLRREGGKVSLFVQAKPSAKPGRWSVLFRFPNTNVKVHFNTAWGGRNPSFERRALPCILLPPEPRKSMSVLEVTGEGSMISTACSSAVWLIGGYELWGSQQPARYSGGGLSHWGARADTWKTGVDLVAPCEETPTLTGLSCHGTRSSSMVRENGTSVAAPLFARYLALAASATDYPPKLPDQQFGPDRRSVAASQVTSKLDRRVKARIKRGEIKL